MSAYDKSVQTITSPTTLSSVPNTEYFIMCDTPNSGGASYVMDAFYRTQTTILHFNSTTNGDAGVINNGTTGVWWSSNGDGGYATGLPGDQIAVVYNTQKKFGVSSAHLTGSKSIVCHANANTFQPAGDLTIDFWFYPTDNGGGGGLFGWGGDSTRWYLRYMTGNKLRMDKETLNPFSIESTNTFTVNAWNHVAVTRRSNTVRLFLNGVLAGSATDSSVWYCYKYQPVIGGIWEWYGIRTHQTGHYDEFRMNLTRARFPDEGFTPPTTAYPDAMVSAPSTPNIGIPTLPNAIGNSNIYHIKNINGANNVTIQTTNNQRIEGITTSWLLKPFDSVSLIASGDSWRIF